MIRCWHADGAADRPVGPAEATRLALEGPGAVWLLLLLTTCVTWWFLRRKRWM